MPPLVGQQLTSIGERQARDSFNEDYYKKQPHDSLVEEGLGIAISMWAEWHGHKIMRVFMAALEDSNFHTEAAKVAEWMNK